MSVIINIPLKVLSIFKVIISYNYINVDFRLIIKRQIGTFLFPFVNSFTLISSRILVRIETRVPAHLKIEFR